MVTVRNFTDRLLSSVRTDGWTNLVTGLGTARDKTTHARHCAGPKLTDEEAEGLYTDNDMAAAACDRLPETALGRGFRVDVESDSLIDGAAALDVAKILEDRAKTLALIPQLMEVCVWSRVFGVGAAVIGADDGQDLADPLALDRVRTFTHMNVVDKRHLQPRTWYADPAAPKYGYPRTYTVTPVVLGSGDAARAHEFAGAREVHESRLIVVSGARTTHHRRITGDQHPDSLLQRMHTVLRGYGSSWASVETLMQEASQGVYKIDGLIDLIASGDTSVVQTRMGLIDVARSVMRAVVLDAESEDFQRHTVNWSGLDKVIDKFMIRLAAAAQMPVTVLLGQSPAGLTATGESDMTLWYDRVDHYREHTCEPALRYLVEIMLAAADTPVPLVPENWCIQFPPLRDPSELDLAEIRHKQAQTDAIYLTEGVVTDVEIAQSRFGVAGYSTDTTIDLDARAAMEADALDDLANPPEPPPMLAPPGTPDDDEDGEDAEDADA